MAIDYPPELIARIAKEIPGQSTKKDETAMSIIDALYDEGVLFPLGVSTVLLDTQTPTHEATLGSGVTARYNNDRVIELVFEPGAVLEVEAA